ncbi:MAG: galactose-1-phosphate uridylyltransferase, partial [Pseudomonadales bacterium]|nr:galactose-1-phosphate uridylyltransferase [Pseudomonadales bacterium]
MRNQQQLMVWEQRWHPLREEWVTITSHRNTRPWSGTVAARETPGPVHDEDCYLCPGNPRVSGQVNDDYGDLFVFDNDHPAFQLEAGELADAYGIYQNRPATGITRVICYAPQHNLTLAELSVSQVRNLITLWCDQTRELAAIPAINQVFIFENKGEVVGVSNPHPHGQIYATATPFKAMETETRAQEKYYRQMGRGLVGDIIASEREDGRRLVVDKEHCLAFVPWFARFPYETFITPQRAVPFIHYLDEPALDDLAA